MYGIIQHNYSLLRSIFSYTKYQNKNGIKNMLISSLKEKKAKAKFNFDIFIYIYIYMCVCVCVCVCVHIYMYIYIYIYIFHSHGILHKLLINLNCF